MKTAFFVHVAQKKAVFFVNFVNTYSHLFVIITFVKTPQYII